MKKSKPSSAQGGKRRMEEDQKKATCRDSGLNLVLCGSNAAAKASAAALILGHKAEYSPVRGKGQAEVCGRHVTLVQLPSLANTQFSSEDELAVQQCVHLCDSGVDAFLLVVPQRPLSDEDKEEFKRIKHFFGEEVTGYCQIVIRGQGEKDTEGIEDIVEAGEGITEILKVSYILGKDPNVQQLLEMVEKMRKKNVPGPYTAGMYITAQLKMHQSYHIQLDKISELEGCNRGLEEITGDLRIVLLGKTGQGKSATGNTILGDSKFVDRLSPYSVTTVSQKETAMVNGRLITVVDTPGLFDTVCDPEETQKEIRKCIAMAAPGPHVFLLVMQLVRFTQEEREAVKIIQQMFGEEAEKYTLVLFTRGDDLRRQTLDEYLKDDSNIKALLRKCGNRYHVFNNIDRSSNDQVPKLLNMISSMLKVNGGKCYTSEMFQKAEEALKQRQDRILQEREEQIKKQIEELQAKHEAAMETLTQQMEEERRRKEEERGRREEEFKCKKKSMKEAMKKLEEEERRKRSTMEKEYKAQKKQNEDWIKQRIEEIQLEKQRQQEKWEKKMQKEQKKREEEEEKRKTRERKRVKEWQDKQMKEREEFNNEKQTMMKQAEEEMRNKQQENEDRLKIEEKKRRDFEEKIKHAEKSRVKGLEEQKRKHEMECQRQHDEEQKRRKEEQGEWERRIKSQEEIFFRKQHQLRQEQKNYEKERQAEKRQRDAEDDRRKMKEEEERRRIEQNAALKIKEKEIEIRKIHEDYSAKLKEEERKSAQQKAEMEGQLKQQKEPFEKQKEKDAKDREESKERERRNMEFLKETHKKEKELLKRETEMAARKQAEEEFNKELDRQVAEARAQGHAEGHKKGKAEVEAERTRVGKCVDGVLNAFTGKSDKK